MMIVDGLGSSEAGGQLSHVSTGAGATTGHVPARARQPRAVATTSTASWRPATTRSAGSPRAAGSPSATSATPTRRRARTRSSTACATPSRATGRGCAPTARIELHGPRLGHDQLRRREDLRRGGRGGGQGAPGVYDCVVAGRPSERWGNEVVADRAPPRRRRASTEASLLTEAERHIARYKLPEGVRVRRRDRALAVGQGRLPLGPPGRRRRLNRAVDIVGMPASTVGAGR